MDKQTNIYSSFRDKLSLPEGSSDFDRQFPVCTMESFLQLLVLPSIVLSYNQDRVASGCLCLNALAHALNKLIFLLYIPVNGIPVSSSTVRSQVLIEPFSPLCTFMVELSWNHLPFITVAFSPVDILGTFSVLLWHLHSFHTLLGVLL
jgi:hypothetical protein